MLADLFPRASHAFRILALRRETSLSIPEHAVRADEASMKDIDALIAGFQSFHQEYVSDKDGRYKELARYGAHSQILMIACCDSRVDPAIITNCSAGDLMVVRNVGNLVPPYAPQSQFAETQAALEFAVLYLKVEHIIVMGHSRCGGIRSLLTRLVDGFDPARALDQWTQIAEPAAREVLQYMPDADLDDQACACSRKALATSLQNLRSYPWIADALEQHKLQIHGWYFNLSNGELERYLTEDDRFELLHWDAPTRAVTAAN